MNDDIQRRIDRELAKREIAHNRKLLKETEREIERLRRRTDALNREIARLDQEIVRLESKK